MNIILFVLGSVLLSIICHIKIPSLMLASLTAATLAAFALQIIAYVQLGYVQALALIAFIASWLMAIVVALPVGWLVRRRRSMEGKQ
jgi:hypothetical protein